ncbi:MAG: sugar ABC transporter ATP-binding protein [Hyphomicrobiaceae bacterium]|nr:sugar ABC transporter ATP-binding protein [Hyphomicrobiaceae bacterium]
MSDPSPVLCASAISKSFGPVRVLFDVDLNLRSGDVHALIGENGAGKSTLMKILGGYLPPSSGTIEIDGAPVRFGNSAAAEAAGIVLIHQEFNLAEQLTVEANVFLGRELHAGPFLDWRRMREKTRELLAELETDIAPQQRVRELSVPQKQMVEIAKALVRDARVLMMDEPTAALTSREAQVLFRQIEKLKAQGVAILYTSHKLDEVKAISDTVTILRDGAKVTEGPVSEFSIDQMATQMVGRDVSDLFPQKAVHQGEAEALSVAHFSVPGHVEDAGFTLRRGEILGFAGLVGAGRTELMEAIVGLRHARGETRIAGKPTVIRSLKDASRHGLAYLTEDRKGHGLLLDKLMRPNVTLLGLDRFAGIFIDERAEDAALSTSIGEFDIRAPDRQVKVSNLSGGNQQKLLLAKTMLVEPDIVIIDEPTRGIDIGTKQQIYEFINGLAEAGKSIILISSEMAEVIGLCHRVIVMRAGRLTGELTGEDISEENIVRLAVGIEGHRVA